MKKKATQTKETAVVTTQTSAVQVSGTASMFAADAGSGVGMEGAGIESFAIPFLQVLQKGSPQVDEASPATVLPGAKAGMLYENISGQLTDGKNGITVVPCAYRRTFLQWAQDDSFKGEHMPEEITRRQAAGQIVDVNGTLYVPDKDGKVDPETADYLQETRNHYVLLVDDKTGAWRQALISLRSTQIKKSRRLMTALAAVKMDVGGKLVTPATFANLVRITTVAESNDKGTWFGWQFKLDGFVQSPELYAAAKQFHTAIVANRAEHNYQPANEEQQTQKGF